MEVLKALDYMCFKHTRIIQLSFSFDFQKVIALVTRFAVTISNPSNS
jgi:hypothetical protein